jgi:hypothetical protein
MKLIWTKNTSVLSKLIRGVLGEPVSHFGVVFDNKLVFHSNLLGAHVEWFETFKRTNTIVFEIERGLALEGEEAVYQAILDVQTGRGYDYGALGYFTYRALLKRLAGVPLPTQNQWQTAAKLLCTEIAQVLPDAVVPAALKQKDLSIVSPYQLYQWLQA